VDQRAATPSLTSETILEFASPLDFHRVCDTEHPNVLARYQMMRGRRPPDNPLPEGIRVDIRKHTRHVLAPDSKAVEHYLAAPNEEAWQRFKADYLALIEQRFGEAPAFFFKLAAQARAADVYLGCSCPTAKNPDVRRCHTTLALAFMREHFADLEVRMP